MRCSRRSRGRDPRTAGPVRIRRAAGTDGPPRVAYAIGRNLGGAVMRNRLRRRLRAAIHSHEALLQAGSSYLVSAGPEALTMDFSALSQAVALALQPEPGRS